MFEFSFKQTELDTFRVLVSGNDYDKTIPYAVELADALKGAIPFDFSVHAEPQIYTAADRREKGRGKEMCVLMVITPKTISVNEGADMLREKGFVVGLRDLVV